MGEKTLCFVDRRCDACGGEGCEACGGTGIVGSIEEREPIPVHPDGVSRALEARRIAEHMSFRELGERLGVSTARASQLCRGAGAERELQESFAIGRLLVRDYYPDIMATSLAKIGDGKIREAEDFILELADELADDRREKPLTEKYQALHAIDSAYRAFEQAVEQARCREDERQAAMALIVAASGTMEINLQVPFPPSVNHYWRWGPRGPLISRDGRDYRQSVGLCIWQGIDRGKHPLPFRGRLHVTVREIGEG